jgi:hypothetical protein
VPEQVRQRRSAEIIPDHLAGGIVNVGMQTCLARSEDQAILVYTEVGNDQTRPDGHARSQALSQIRDFADRSSSRQRKRKP